MPCDRDRTTTCQHGLSGCRRGTTRMPFTTRAHTCVSLMCWPVVTACLQTRWRKQEWSAVLAPGPCSGGRPGRGTQSGWSGVDRPSTLQVHRSPAKSGGKHRMHAPSGCRTLVARRLRWRCTDRAEQGLCWSPKMNLEGRPASSNARHPRAVSPVEHVTTFVPAQPARCKPPRGMGTRMAGSPSRAGPGRSHGSQ